MKRIYQSVLEAHLRDYRQMVVLTGPRAVGKTTLCKEIISSIEPSLYLNWNADREIILAGPEKIYNKIKPTNLADKLPVIVLDDLYLYKEWKNLLKGYYDILSDRCRFIITVNDKVGTYRAGQDSMMGRYFSYCIHPLTIAELCQRSDFSKDSTFPQKISRDDWSALLEFGGFPEPFQKSTKSFHTRWSNNFRESIIKIDVRELSKVNDLQRLDLLAQMIQRNVGCHANFSKIARDLQTSVPTIQHWHTVLSNHYYCFALSSWSHNVKRSLRKAPKFYLYDWSQITNINRRIENLVACHLNKAVDFWNDTGIGIYELYYICDKDKHEVDFLVVKDQKPWLMLDVKESKNSRLNPSLSRFCEQLKVPHVFQVVADMPYIDKDCFSVNKPVIVPLTTFLSQLV